MPLPKLSPLQSRLAASLFASIMLLLLYLFFSLPNFAYAADVNSIQPEDHNHEQLLDFPLLDDFHELELREEEYESEFFGVDRSIIGRATTQPTGLVNNRVEATNVQLGQSFYYVFTNASLWGSKSPAAPGLPSQIKLHKRRLVTSDNPIYRLNSGSDDDDDDDGEESELKRRQDISELETNRTLYITVTTCDQPTSDTTTNPPPQLQLYVSQSANNTNPGPDQSSDLQEVIALEGGYALHVVNATGDVYMGIYAQNATEYSTGVYSAQIAASIDAPFHTYWNSTDPNLFLVDSDDFSALLFTDPFIADATNTTLLAEWMDHAPPYVIFASDATDTSLVGIERSYCGLKTKAQVQENRPGQTVSTIVTGMTSIGNLTLPRQQFFVNGLGAGKTYNVMLAMDGNSTDSGNFVVGGGGQVFKQTQFDMLQDGNCAVIYDLSFCDQTAYSVPSNPNVFPNMSALAAFYDNATQASFANFEKVLAQIPCETTSSAQYSLARNCDDCREAYKSWLCAVSIPRCTDFTKEKPWLQPRAMGQPFPNGTLLPARDREIAKQTPGVNISRNARIDELLVPGPYKEVLPCDELCFNLVRSCPAVMGFNCPQAGDIGFNESYGVYPQFPGDDSGRISNITCNSPGTIYYLSAGGRVPPSTVFVCLGLLVGVLFI
ncbi:stretch-activated Ca2+-permeable channel component-domain-containing protein [Rhexocercosporidium sp. MPI-PUGE-AT-0058]|nr:stretch-activated Ca2+-permeable channel component-domain-containing protein [Rhexocercosporidium sp. MPI-PUGE-AT-0058]